MASSRVWKAIAAAAVLVAVASAGVAVGAARGGDGGAAQVVPRASGFPTENTFVPITPCRIANTQTGARLGVGAGDARGFQMHGSTSSQGGAAACGIPTYATALEISVTAIRATGPGYLRVGPTDEPIPTATFLNYGAGQNLTSAGTVKVESGSGLNLQAKAFVNPTHITIDVLGYYLDNLYAVISPINGELLSSNGVVSVEKTGTGTYSVDFRRNTAGCAISGTAGGTGQVSAVATDPVSVATFDSAGNPADIVFTLAVTC